jgi:hypothetical protein
VQRGWEAIGQTVQNTATRSLEIDLYLPFNKKTHMVINMQPETDVELAKTYLALLTRAIAGCKSGGHPVSQQPSGQAISAQPKSEAYSTVTGVSLSR